MIMTELLCNIDDKMTNVMAPWKMANILNNSHQNSLHLHYNNNYINSRQVTTCFNKSTEDHHKSSIPYRRTMDDFTDLLLIWYANYFMKPLSHAIG